MAEETKTLRIEAIPAGKQRTVDEALRQSEERFRLLVQAVKDYAIFMLDPQGNIVSWNEGAERAKGYKESEIIGQNFSRFYTPEDIASGTPDELLRLAKEQGRIEVEGWRVRKDGSRFWADVILATVYDAEGVHRGFAKVTRDVTTQRQAEEAIKNKQVEINQLQKLESLGRLAGGIAHDFNNLLAGILGCTEVLSPMHLNDAAGLEEIQEIQKACERGRQLVQQLLAYSRRQISIPKPVQLNEVIKGLKQLLLRGVGPTIKTHFDLAPDLKMIQMDVSQIEQVLMNLAINARDAIPVQGTIRIKTENAWVDDVTAIDGLQDRPCEAVILTVQDTGTGMTKDVVSKIFEPFFTTKPQGKGTGLGLSTVYGIIQQNQGGVSVYSIPGMGATFKIFFPVRGSSEGGSFPQPASITDESALTGDELILVVDDDPLVLRNTIRALQKRGYSILSAAHAEDAEGLFKKAKGKIQLLLSDIIMPGKNGKQLADLLQKEDPALKVLFMSGYPADTIASHGIMKETVNLLEKPFNALSLAKKVREVLDQ